MPPIASTTIAGLRTPVSYPTPTHGQLDKTMRTVNTMMSGDTSQHNGFPNGDEEAASCTKNSKLDFFYKEPCLYTQTIYVNAAKVFSALKHESRDELENPYYRKKPDTSDADAVIPEIDFEDDSEKRLTFELAFETLKYQRVFEDLLAECSFFTHFPECQEDHALVMVILWDYQNRKFQQRIPAQDEVINPDVQSVEDAILEYKTKLNASLARNRIKASAPSLEFLLPDKVRSKEDVRSKMPVYIWINNLKSSMDSVTSAFKDDGYRLIDVEMPLEGQVFHIDAHCADVLVFPPECREFIQEHELFQNGHVVMQDKSSCIAPQTVKYLIGDDDDVIHVNAGSGVITTHIASLMHTSTGNILAFGANKSAINKSIERYGAKNIKVQNESFLDIDMEDNKFKNVKVVMVTADCSKSGISNPVDFIVNEGEDMKILKFSSVGETDDTKLGEMIANHGALLKQAMKLSKVQAVVYMTRSVYDAENDNVVSRAIEQINTIQQRKYPYRVVPPVLPFSGYEIEKGIGICGKVIKFPATDKNSGCYVAVMTREPEDIKEFNRDVLARAQARGLLGGKKKQKKSPPAETNGDQDHESEDKDDKLLEKRVKRAPRKLRTSANGPKPFPAYTKPSAPSIVRSQIYSTPKVGQRATKSTPSFSNKASVIRVRPLAEPVERKEKKPIVAEHVKVVKHPAPFSKRKKQRGKKAVK